MVRGDRNFFVRFYNVMHYVVVNHHVKELKHVNLKKVSELRKMLWGLRLYDFYDGMTFMTF